MDGQVAAPNSPLRNANAQLKKMIAAKDAQLEAFAGRVDVLMEDNAELRAECESAHVRMSSSVQEAVAQCQREVEAHAKQAEEARMRARRWEQDARAAVARADEAEHALITAETSFARDLDALRTLLHSSDDGEEEAAAADRAQAAATATHAQLETLRAELHALELVVAEVRASEQLLRENTSLRSELADATRRNDALRRQLEARDELAKVTAERLQMAARKEVEHDVMAETAEDKRGEGSEENKEAGNEQSDVDRGGSHAVDGDDAPERATPCATPARVDGSDKAASSCATCDRRCGASPNHEPSTVPFSAARQRWLRELASRAPPTSPAAASTAGRPAKPRREPDGSVLDSGGVGEMVGAVGGLQFSPPVSFCADEAAEGYSRRHQRRSTGSASWGSVAPEPGGLASSGKPSVRPSASAPSGSSYARAPPRSSQAGAVPVLPIDLGGPQPTERPPPPPPQPPLPRPPVHHNAYTPVTSSHLPPPRTSAHAESAARRAGYSREAQALVQSMADRRTRDQIRALLVAKETALSAVAAL